MHVIRLLALRDECNGGVGQSSTSWRRTSREIVAGIAKEWRARDALASPVGD